MGKIIRNGGTRFRLGLRLAFVALTNGYVEGFIKGKIFTGSSKEVCLPGLNCYSCPGALGACPIGAMQAVLSDRNYNFSFYVFGFLTIMGALFGRLICGWLCPFGLLQDLLYKIPFYKKLHSIKGEKYLSYLKYIILLVFVIILPILILDVVGQGNPWFCKWICPSGTFMAGWPLVLMNEGIREAAGMLFLWKNFILITILILSIMIFRPFCRYLCPLGAIYGLFNPVSMYQLKVDHNLCTSCKKCQSTCKLNIATYENPSSKECIRCGDCVRACPEKAISSGIIVASGIIEKNSLK